MRCVAHDNLDSCVHNLCCKNKEKRKSAKSCRRCYVILLNSSQLNDRSDSTLAAPIANPDNKTREYFFRCLWFSTYYTEQIIILNGFSFKEFEPDS